MASLSQRWQHNTIDCSHPRNLFFFTKCPGIKSQKDVGVKNSLVLSTFVFKCNTHFNMTNKNNQSPQGNKREVQPNACALSYRVIIGVVQYPVYPVAS